MAEYIDKGSVINRLIDLENEFQQYKPFHGFEHAMYRKIYETEIAIGEMPAADVEPVRHGHWVDDNGNITFQARFNFKCSRCGSYQHTPVEKTWGSFTKEHIWCHNCGAKMDEVIE